MKHIYIFNIPNNALQYGIGTYINTLLPVLRKNNFKITVVELFSECECTRQEINQGIRYLYLPGYENKNMNRKYYYRNIFYVLHPYIDPSDENIAHINYRSCRDLMLQLKNTFHFKVYLTWHFSSWRDWMDENELEILLEKRKCHKVLTQREMAIQEDLDMEQRLLDDCCDKVIVLSEQAYRSMQAIYRLAPDKLKIIYNGIEDFYHERFSPKEIKASWNLPEDEKIILFVGRLDENKNASLVIRAFHQIKQKLRAVRLVIAGAGNFETPLSFIHPADATHILFTGFVNKEKLHELYAIADLGVVPSRYEESGYVATEMMMHGLPVVANRTGGLAELIEEDVSGELIDLYTGKNEQKSVDLLAAALLRILQDETRCRRLGAAARKRYETNFSMPLFEQKMIDFYQS